MEARAGTVRCPPPPARVPVTDRMRLVSAGVTASAIACIRSGRLPMPSLPAETVEFPVSHTPEKSVPLVRREAEDWPSEDPAVANADLTAGQARYLDAVAVGITQRALNPVRT